MSNVESYFFNYGVEVDVQVPPEEKEFQGWAKTSCFTWAASYCAIDEPYTRRDVEAALGGDIASMRAILNARRAGSEEEHEW